jgi:hypothetical protein
MWDRNMRYSFIWLTATMINPKKYRASNSSINSNFLANTGDWISNDSTFEIHQHYTWYKINSGERPGSTGPLAHLESNHY